MAPPGTTIAGQPEAPLPDNATLSRAVRDATKLQGPPDRAGRGPEGRVSAQSAR